MYKTARLLLPLLLLLLWTTPVAAERLEEEITKTFSLASGALVSVENTNGSIDVEAWDGDEVRVTAIKHAKASSRSRAEEILDQIRIEFRQTGEGLVIETHLPRSKGSWIWGSGGGGSVEYMISVPASARVQSHSVNGSVVVEGVLGGVEARSTNGKVRLYDTGGETYAKTTNGSIEARLQDVDRSVEMSSTNGKINVSLPESAGYDLEARTTNGRVRVDIPMVLESQDSRGRKIRGAINGGGIEVSLRTVNGSITVEPS